MRTARAFTLIELLIVIAIMAILSAAALAVVTAPLADMHRSHAESRLNGGFAMFHSVLVADLHDARAVRTEDDGAVLAITGPGDALVRYAVDDGGILRRTQENGQDVALVPSVGDARFAVDGAFVGFSVDAGIAGWDRDIRLARKGSIAFGIFGGGGTP